MLKARLKKVEEMWSATSPKPFTRPSRHAAFVALSAVLCLTFSGCGGPPRAKAVEVDVARKTLTQVLEHWKSGGAIGDFRKQTPEIIIQEADWSNGRRLQDFALDGEPQALDGNWFCEVELTLASPKGDKTVKKTVTYAVGTDPVLTVFHAML